MIGRFQPPVGSGAQSVGVACYSIAITSGTFTTLIDVVFDAVAFEGEPLLADELECGRISRS